MKKPYYLALITILLWSFGTYLGRQMSMKSEFLVVGVAYTFTFITMLAYSLARNKGKISTLWRDLTIKDVLLGPLGYFVYSVGLIQSFRAFNSASETTILNYTWPVFTVLFSETIFKQATRKSRSFYAIEALGSLFGILAVMVLATRGRLTELDVLNLPGIAWGLLSGLSYGVFSAYSGTVSRERQGAFLLSAISTSWILMLIFSVQEIDLIRTLTSRDILYAFASGGLLNVVGYLAWTSANRIAREQGINISSIASLMFTLPILSLAVISLLLGERQLLQPYFFGSLVLVGVSSIICQKADAIETFLRQNKGL